MGISRALSDQGRDGYPYQTRAEMAIQGGGQVCGLHPPFVIVVQASDNVALQSGKDGYRIGVGDGIGLESAFKIHIKQQDWDRFRVSGRHR